MRKKIDAKGIADRLNKLNDMIEEDKKNVEVTNFIPIDSIIFNEDNAFNMDDSEESIAELAENIKENGLLHNIVVAEIEPNKYLLISGERRTRAMQYLGMDKIKATIKKNLSDLEKLKMLFFANSETREYSTEEKVHIIEKFTEKIKRFENTSEKVSAVRFREYVAQAFNINKRQANKLIAITSELVTPLKEMLFDDDIDINTAAALAQLPGGYQEYAVDIMKATSNENESALDDKKKYAIGSTLEFAKRAKNIISKTNSSLAKDMTSRIYYTGRLAQAEEELGKVNEELSSPLSDREQISEAEMKKEKIEKNVAKFTAALEQLNKNIDVETQKQNAEVQKVYTNTMFSVGKGLDDVHKDKSGKIAQSKKIAKEIQAVDTAIKKLLNMNPSEELKMIQELIEKYKDKISL